MKLLSAGLISAKLFIVVLSLQTIGNICLGSEAESATQEAQTSERRKSSSDFRKEKKFQVLGQPTGWRRESFVSGVSAGYFLNSDLMITTGFLIGQGFYTGTGYQHESMASQTFSLGLKKFLGNTFYGKGSLSHSKIDYHYSSTGSWLGTSGDTDRRLEGTMIAGSFVIGNQWQWSGFTLGCDWAGFSIPITSNVTRDQVTGSYGVASDTDSARREIFSDIRYELVNFYLGASF